ncbi:MAG: hypothetical protein LBI85_06900 [Spirochaetaceae bacterium]|jgi:hypothetical protein|nr:hypothetical protein [Spirochaetaceae bacterium]
MTRPRIFAAALSALLLYAPGADAWGRRDGDAPEARGKDWNRDMAERKQETLRIEGRVRLVGNMPFPGVVITDDRNNDWYVEDADRELVKDRQQEMVTVEGTPEYRDLVLANGEKIGVKRYLRNIRVIAF